jgi:uncharacterized protein involved in type VI secretion and phage assembly
MSTDLDLKGLLEGRVGIVENELDASQERVYGVTLARVTSLDDPKFLGRVQVEFPWLTSKIDSAWARIATAWAGGTRGTYLLPEKGDEVVCAFRHGDLRHPYILGFLWDDTDRPPVASPRLEKRELRSKSGHGVVFDDFPGMCNLTLESQGGHEVVLDDTLGAMQISVKDSSHTMSIVIDTVQKKISISVKTGQIELSTTAGQISLSAPVIDIHAKGQLNLQGDAAVNVNGKIVRIN